MKFSLVIYASPTQPGSHSAFHFALALLQQGHQLHRVFFYGEGCRHGFLNSAQEEAHHTSWEQLITEHQLDAVICVTAALKRNLLTETEARQLQPATLRPGFVLSGLGQLADAAASSDRVVTFR